MITIHREEFINIVFNIGLDCSHQYDTIVSSVILGDKFVALKNIGYSVELAHVVSVLLAKYKEDFGYSNTIDAIINTGNRKIIQLEWDVFSSMKYKIYYPSFINIFYILVLFCDPKYTLGTLFWEISKQVCEDPKLLYSTNPKTIVLAVILLYQRGKLKAVRDNKMRMFKELIERLSYEYQVHQTLIIKKYIELKRNQC
ncbi:MAG: hypothetical protein QXV60_00270 [Nitrososphaerota archaeon]